MSGFKICTHLADVGEGLGGHCGKQTAPLPATCGDLIRVLIVGGTQHMSLSAADMCLVVCQVMRAPERGRVVRDDRFQRCCRVLTHMQLQQATYRYTNKH